MADTDPLPRQEIPADPEARRRWAEQFAADLADHPYDERATWRLPVHDEHPIR